MAKPDITTIIKAFIKIRDEIAARKKQYEAVVKDLKEKQQRLSTILQQQLTDLNVESLKTSEGTVFEAKKSSVKVIDWDATIEHIKETGSFHLLNHAVNKTAVTEFVAENGAPPPGTRLEYSSEIQIRRPSAKG